MPSINPSERDAIYAWEHLRKGKHVPIAAARDLYQYLKTRTQLKHGSKLIPKVSDPDAVVTMEQLREQHGLLVDGPWFEVLLEIPIERRMYYRALLREHKTLRIAPQVRLETIHGAKGAEAKHVALFLEQSRRTWDEAQHMRDDEHRVFYVGATRAIDSLHVIEAASQYGYQFPRKTAENTGG
jgi:superfamily I DNA/RNA helicase